MLVLVTGGAGFIGSAIARALIEQGHGVRVFDNLQMGFRTNVPAEAELLLGDIRNHEQIRAACEGVEVVFHQAAFKSVPKSIADPLMAETCNSLGTLNVLMASVEAGVRRVIYASSSSVYGDRDGTKHESLPTVPVSPYGVSKLTGEHYCRIWSGLHGISTVSLRYFNVFGPGQRPDSTYGAVFPSFISALDDGRRPVIHGDGNQTRDFTFIEDVVDANLLAMSADSRVDGVVMNVCAGAPQTVNALFKEIAEVMSAHVTPHYGPARSGDILHSHGDISLAIELLGWAPKSNWHDSVEATVEWFISSGGRIPLRA